MWWMRAPCCARPCCSCPRATASVTWSRRRRSAADVVAATSPAQPPPTPCARRRAAPHRPAASPSTTSARTPSTWRRPSATRDAYVQLLAALADAGLTQDGGPRCRVKLVGGRPGAARRRRARSPSTTPATICQAAAHAGTTVTLDMEDHTTTDSTLAILRELRQDFPWVRRGAAGLPAPHRGRLPRPGRRGLAGAAVQGRLRRAGVRRVPGPRRGRQVLRALPEGADGRPGLPDGRHPRPAPDRHRRRARGPRNGRAADSYEFQMLYGIRPDEQQRLADQGEQMRVYVPYGERVVRLPDAPDGRAPRQPAFFLRSLLAPKG